MNKISSSRFTFAFCVSILLGFALQAQEIKPICYIGLSADLMPTTGEIWLTATQFSAGPFSSEDKSIHYRIERGTPNFGTEVPKDSIIFVGCVGFVPIRLWIKAPNQNWSYCDTYIDIQNNMGATPKEGNCPKIDLVNDSTKHNIKGSIFSSNGKAFGSATAIITNRSSWKPIKKDTSISVPIVNGKFSVAAPLAFVDRIYVSVEKNDNPLNGVSTFDIVLISKHILGTQKISDKYSIIAADINKNGKITTGDNVELKKMVMGLQKAFTNNRSWRFFDANLNEETYGLPFQMGMNVNFTAVKVGDINGNANPLSAARKDRRHSFYLKNRFLKAGETCEIAWNEGEGFGFTMRYLADNLELVSLDENSALLENGLISTVQVGTTFKAVFKAKNDIWLQDALSLNSDITKAEFVQNSEAFDLDLQFEGKNLGLKLFQNQPNPFHQSTLIRFQLLHNEQISISITDISGKEIKTIEGFFSEGYNEIPLELDTPVGLYFCKLKTANESAVIKILNR